MGMALAGRFVDLPTFGPVSIGLAVQYARPAEGYSSNGLSLGLKYNSHFIAFPIILSMCFELQRFHHCCRISDYHLQGNGLTHAQFDSILRLIPVRGQEFPVAGKVQF